MQNAEWRSAMKNRRHTLAKLVLFCSAFCLAPSAFGEELDWRQDYQKAREEATAKGRPLLIDLGTENCYWCKQLDLKTFTDPTLAAYLNERFVLLKVDAGRDPRLADALRVQSYPTLVIASPEGRILGYQEGFVEAPRLQELLQRLAAAATTPDWMTHDYEEAGKAIALADFARALTLLSGIVEDGKDRPVQTKARQLIQDLEQQASGRCLRAREQFEKGQVDDAIATLNDLGRTYPGTRAARDGGKFLATLTSRPRIKEEQRERRAKELLQQAKEDYRAGQYLFCLDRCELLANQFTDLAEGAEASRLAAEIKANTEWMKQACDQLGDRLSLLYLSMAETWLKRGQPQQAVYYLERVVQSFPNSRHAEAAQVRLAQLQGQPSMK
jgi:thioredoxin-like negative regulator of GroEL